MDMPKYIGITGGVLSGLGKGIITSSIGLLLKSRGYNVTAIKIDPYLNCDAGTMNPYQHGEVFVLSDGGEVDLDLGNYERFLDINLTRDNNITTGKIYKNVIEKERKGEYLGKTVQIVPHITDEIKGWIRRVAKESQADFCLIEIGGTVGDIESMPFLEAMRQLYIEEGRENVLFVHTTLVPVLKVVGEQKTKPTQHSVKELRAIGINPDIIVGRSNAELTKETKEKISLFCNVPVEGVFSSPDVSCIYEIPLLLEKQGLPSYILKRFNIPYKEANLKDWENFVEQIKNAENEVSIAIVGKYTHLADSYLSIIEAFHHAGSKNSTKVNIRWIEAEELEKGRANAIEKVDGILVPGGFGVRGAEGKIKAINFARENEIPFLGICFGFQLAVVEYGRNVIGLKCNSLEIDKDTEHPIITLLPEQRSVDKMGGTMRLGEYEVVIKENTLAYKIYGRKKVYERHRHRYEINPDYFEILEKNGIVFSGFAENGRRVEIIELPSHPYFIASQFHPEFTSRPLKPSPLFDGLIKASLKNF